MSMSNVGYPPVMQPTNSSLNFYTVSSPFRSYFKFLESSLVLSKLPFKLQQLHLLLNRNPTFEPYNFFANLLLVSFLQNPSPQLSGSNTQSKSTNLFDML